MERPSGILLSTPRHDAHTKKTEAEFVERIGDKTRIIKHSHNYTTTGQRHRTLDHRHPDFNYGSHLYGHRRAVIPISEISTDKSSSEDESITDIPFPFSFSLPPYGRDADTTTEPKDLRVTNQSPRTKNSMQAARQWAYTENIYNITHSSYVKGSHASDNTIADFVIEKTLRDTEKTSLPLLRWM